MTHLPISVIVPTIGRPASLERLLQSLAIQSYRPFEVLIADGSSSSETESIANQLRWRTLGLEITRIPVSPPNAVSQRKAAIARSTGEYLLFLDDDVVLEPTCIENMISVILSAEDIVAVVADFNNQTWSRPTTAWRWYLRVVHQLREGAWSGKVIGPLLRFGFNPIPKEPQSMEWLGTCNSMIRRRTYEISGGFSDFFLHRCTMNEDVDLGLKIARYGRIMFCPSARLGHFHAAGGRVSPAIAAEDDLYNRFLILKQTLGQSAIRASWLICVFFVIETTSNIVGCFRRASFSGFGASLLGRSRALARIFLGAGRRPTD